MGIGLIAPIQSPLNLLKDTFDVHALLGSRAVKGMSRHPFAHLFYVHDQCDCAGALLGDVSTPEVVEALRLRSRG